MSSIWYKSYSIEALNQRSTNTLAEFLGITFTEIGHDTLSASMPVTARTKQPIGIVHGGANVVLAETVASTAANMVVDNHAFYCVGLDINANHIRSVREGIVSAIAKPIHLGRSTQVWQIDLFNSDSQITCSSRMTAAVISKSTPN